ncbi:MAG: hypothetical protein Q7J05_02955 [Paludibacter sp.]|nr:hypothetical protein [Paludibacter sp.]
MKKKAICITSLLFAVLMLLSAQSRRDLKAIYNSQYSYELLCLGVGQDGTKAIKVWSYGKTAEIAAHNAKRDAVAAVIFKGVPGGNGAAPTPPILGIDGYEKNESFFDEFFKAGGMYLGFINLTVDGVPSGADRIKTEKGFKVAIYASVNFDALRKYLEDQGMARRLDAGF